VLLVVMIVEILGTISTAEQTELLHEPETFKLVLWEPLLLGVLVIILAGAIYLLHRTRTGSGQSTEGLQVGEAPDQK
jgi:hypothetical protein